MPQQMVLQTEPGGKRSNPSPMPANLPGEQKLAWLKKQLPWLLTRKWSAIGLHLIVLCFCVD
jgi:hypothetical protein